MTDLLDGLIGFLVVGLLNLLIVSVLNWGRSAAEAAFLSRVYLATLSLRAIIALALNTSVGNSALAATFWGDSGTYDAAGYLLASRWHGEGASTAAAQALSGYGFVYYVGAVYYVFGRNQLFVQLLNATIGSVTVLVVYAIARRLFGSYVARWSAPFMAFFPQMLFWSAGMYKDPAVLLCIAVSMFAVLRLRDAFSPGMATLLGLAALCLLSLRFYIFYFVALAALGAFFFGRKGPIVPRLASYGLVVAVLFGAFALAVKPETLDMQRSYMTLDQVQVTRADQAMWGKSAYGTEYDVSTPGGALRALPLGLIYLLFAPFPWAISSVRQLLVLPETLVWYALMPAFIRGLAYSIRHRLRDVLPILVFTVTLTIAYALMQGNVGTAYRQRTQVTMFYFIFMAVGIVQRAHRAERTEADDRFPSLPAEVRPAGNGHER
jgi:4-amino-4-deoxy-L-arabinose transferase-like glycosyltransferase